MRFGNKLLLFLLSLTASLALSVAAMAASKCPKDHTPGTKFSDV